MTLSVFQRNPHHHKGYTMDIKDLNELAKTHADAIFLEELSKAEIVALLALIQARVMVKVYADIPQYEIAAMVAPGKAPETKTRPPKEPVKPPNKPIKYDPVYDPAPPFDVDKPPERVSTGKVLAEPNHACVCVTCNKVGYTVNKLIKDGDRIDDFLTSYTPMPGIQPLTRKIEIMNVDGQISIDCPICHANKSMYLTGHPVHNG